MKNNSRPITQSKAPIKAFNYYQTNPASDAIITSQAQNLNHYNSKTDKNPLQNQRPVTNSISTRTPSYGTQKFNQLQSPNQKIQDLAQKQQSSNPYGTRYGQFQNTGSFIVNSKFVKQPSTITLNRQDLTQQNKQNTILRVQTDERQSLQTFQKQRISEKSQQKHQSSQNQNLQRDGYSQSQSQQSNQIFIKGQNQKFIQQDSSQKTQLNFFSKKQVQQNIEQSSSTKKNSEFMQLRQKETNKIQVKAQTEQPTLNNNSEKNKLNNHRSNQGIIIQSKRNNFITDDNPCDEDQTLVFNSRPSVQQTLKTINDRNLIQSSQEEDDDKTLVYQQPLTRDPTLLEESKTSDIIGLNQKEVKLSKDTFKDTNYTKLLQNQHITLTYTEAQFYRPQENQDTFTQTQSVQNVSKIVLNKNQINFQKPLESAESQKPITKIQQSNPQVKSDKVAEKKSKSGIEPVLGVYKHRSDEQQHVALTGGVSLVKHLDKDVVVNRKIFQHFGKGCVEKIAKNQTIIYGEDCKNRLSNKLETIEEIITFLKLSQNFKHIENIEKLAEGAEAVVYKLNYLGYDEVVIKVPKVKPKFQVNTREHNEAILEGYEDLIHESQLIKAIYHEDYTVEVKEEIVEIDLSCKELKRYLVIVERARFSLYDLYSFKAVNNSTVEKNGLWFNETLRNKNLEYFSVYKFFYYFYQTAKAIDYLHSQGVIYSDMKPQNLLVMRNQKVKIGDFGVSILMNSNQDNYQIKGLSPSWCIPEIQNRFNKCSQQGKMRQFYTAKWHIDLLKLNDIYAVCLTFSQELVDFLIQSQNLSKDDRAVVNYFGQIGLGMALLRTQSLQDGIKMMEILLKDTFTFYYTLIHVLRKEKKYDAAYLLGVTLEKQVSNMKFDEHQKLLIYFNILKLMCQFTVSQGNYQQSLQHLEELR